MKKILSVGVVASCALSLFGSMTSELVDGVYTINVPEGHTEVLTQQQADIICGGACTEVVKTGTGTLKNVGDGSTTFGELLASYAGNITVKEGIYFIDHHLGLGATNTADTTYAHQITVKEGATLQLDPTFKTRGCFNDGAYYFTVGGAGVDGVKGALHNTTTIHGSGVIYISSLTLTANTLLNFRSQYTLSYKSDRTTLTMNGWTLTTSATMDLGFSDRATIDSPGDIFITKTLLPVQLMHGLGDHPESKFHIADNGSVIRHGNNNDGGVNACKWTLSTGDNVSYAGRKQYYVASDTGFTDWNGPMILNGRLSLMAHNDLTSDAPSIYAGFKFNGPISGDGSLYLSDKGLDGETGLVHLKLTGTNTYTGNTIIGNNNRLVVESTNSLSTAGTLIVTNGVVMLDGTETDSYGFGMDGFKSPRIKVHATADASTRSTIDLGGIVHAAGFEKTGDGTVYINGEIKLDEPMDIKAGTVVLPQYAAGWKWGFLVVGDSYGRKWVDDIETPMWNSTAYWLYRQAGLWNGYVHGQTFETSDERKANIPIVRYKGYIWNRDTTNVTWSFCKRFNQLAYVKIDGEMLMETANWSKLFVIRKELTPGPHEIVFQGYNSSANGPREDANGRTLAMGYNTSGFVPVEDEGLSDAEYGVDQTYFDPVEDGGTGELITYALWDDDEPATWLKAVNVAEHTALDLNGNTYEFESVEGAGGMITNGNAVITSAVTVDVEKGGLTLKDGTLTLSNNVSVIVADLDALKSNQAGYPVCGADKLTVNAGVALSGEGDTQKWRLAVEGNMLRLYQRSGTVFILR